MTSEYPTKQEAKFALEYAQHCLEFQQDAVKKAAPDRRYLRRKNVRNLETTIKILRLYQETIN